MRTIIRVEFDVKDIDCQPALDFIYSQPRAEVRQR